MPQRTPTRHLARRDGLRRKCVNDLTGSHDRRSTGDDEKELPFYRYRHILRPGISGGAQVNQRHVAQVDEVLWKLHYDFYYIKHFTPWLDLLIVFRTFHTVLTGFGSK